MLSIRYHNKFKKDYKNAIRRGLDQNILKEVLEFLVAKKELPQKYKDHALKGNFKGHRECHLQPDWLLIYKINDDELILELVRTGTHSDLF
ncbi:MAG: type II toxin-antitoxin system YafQ family toxin [Clostridia bacterium]